MRNLLRKPLTWMILAECAVVAALILMAWHLIAASAPAVAAPPALLPAPASDPAAETSPAAPKRSKAIVRQLPGLNVDTGFWRLRLMELNREEAALELLEWRIVHSAMDTVQRYMESVVLPSVERAERRGA
jgi:hypothetical protein